MGVTPDENGTLPMDTLTGPTDSAVWQQINSDFPVGFAVHLEATIDDYTGDLISLANDRLKVSLQGQGTVLQLLSVTLPGINPLVAAIPGPENMDNFQSVGISVESKLLSVIVDCHVITSIWLANMPQSVDFLTAEVLNPPTFVSFCCG